MAGSDFCIYTCNQTWFKTLRGPMRGLRTLNNVVGCGSVLDALLFTSTTENEVVGFFN
jgi:hypothetical protein